MRAYKKVSNSLDPDQTRHCLHARIQKILSEAVKLLHVFFQKFNEGREDSNTSISGPSSAANETPFK